MSPDERDATVGNVSEEWVSQSPDAKCRIEKLRESLRKNREEAGPTAEPAVAENPSTQPSDSKDP